MSDIIVNLESNTLYSGPGPNYAVAATGVRGKSATVRWKEGSYYYVKLTTPRVFGYISEDDVSFEVSGRPRTLVPSHSERYVAANENAYLGPGTAYRDINAPNRAQMVDYLGEK